MTRSSTTVPAVTSSPMRRSFRTPAGMVAALLLALLIGGCGSGPSTVPTPEPLRLDVATERVADEVPAVGTDSTLDVGSWNLEWFGDPGNGPVDEALQLTNVAGIMAAVRMDIWSVQEVTDPEHFDRLLDRLDGYTGFLADDPRVTDGATYYSDFGGNELKVGLVYRDGITVDSARVILPAFDHAFAGRPPVEVHLSTGDGEAEAELVLILLHAKAGADRDDRDRRAAGADVLKTYLDSRYPDRLVLVAGDFNDDVDTSITSGYPSPYAAFVEDDEYAFLTAPLSAAGQTSTVFYSDMIDHHLASDELAALHLPGSAVVFPAGSYLPGYGDTTSDHYPVLARFDTGSPAAIVAVVDERGVAHLTWTGASSPTVDIYRDGRMLVTTEDDGRHSDEVPLADGLIVTYRVCEAGTDTCSNEATAVF